MVDVVITQHQAIEEAVAEALSHIPLKALVRGKRVAVKPNDTWASADDKTGVTQPDTLRAVLRRLKQDHPRELIVTGGAGAAETEDVFRSAGLLDVVEEEGATFFDHNRAPFVPVELASAPAADVEGQPARTGRDGHRQDALPRAQPARGDRSLHGGRLQRAA